MTSGFQFAQPESKILRERASPTIAIEWRTMAKRVTSVVSRTWCLDRHGFGQCLGDVEGEARENPSWLAATINQAASGSRIYVSSCDPRTGVCQNPVAIGRGPYTSRWRCHAALGLRSGPRP